MYETKQEFVYILPIPGLEPGGVQVETTGESLVVRGERKPFYQNEEARQIHRSVWSQAVGAFEAQFTLPGEIDVEGVQASFRNGVLEIHLPKAVAARPRAIPINVAEG